MLEKVSHLLSYFYSSINKGTTKANKKVYMIITYELPIISARAIPQQINFYNQNIGELERFN